MRGAFVLAGRYIAYHKGKTLVVVACLSLTIYLPITLHWLVRHLQASLTARAASSPMIVAAKGSRFDVAFCSLYFSVAAPEMIAMEDLNEVGESPRIQPIPLHVRFRAKGFPVVGTTADYFSFRNLKVAQGEHWNRLGDCLLGQAVARQLGLSPGDKLQTDPENMFDLAGEFPLTMRVIGVLAGSDSVDDQTVFVSLKTAWVIAGIGHGHSGKSKKHNTQGSGSVANAGVKTHTEITAENVDSFHFHGDESEFPISVILAVSDDEKSATLLLGRYLDPDATLQVVRPSIVINDLMKMVFRVQSILDFAAIVLAVVTVCFIVLVMSLSLRLRRREMETMFKLGGSRGLIVSLQLAELVIVLLISAAVAAILVALTVWLAPSTFQSWVMGMVSS